MANLPPPQLRIELSGVKPTPGMGELVQQYLGQLCQDLNIPVVPVLQLDGGPQNPPSASSLFRITLNAHKLRTRLYPVNFLDTRDPDVLYGLLTMALYEQRESLITPEIAHYLKRNWQVGSLPEEGFREFLRYFARYNFSLARAKDSIGSTDQLISGGHSDNASSDSCLTAVRFEQAIEFSLTESPAQFGVEVSGAPADLFRVANAAARDLGVFIPNLRTVDDAEKAKARPEMQFRINDVRLPKIKALSADELVLSENPEDLKKKGVNSFWLFDPLSSNQYVAGSKPEAKAGKAIAGPDGAAYAGWILRQLIFGKAGSLVAAPIVHLLLEQVWKSSSQSLFTTFEKKFSLFGSPYLLLTAIIRRLLDERVPIRDLPRILESLLGLREVSTRGKKEVHHFSERSDSPLRIAFGPFTNLNVEQLASAARLGVHAVSEDAMNSQSMRLLPLSEDMERSLAEVDGESASAGAISDLLQYLRPEAADTLAIIVSQNNRSVVRESLRFELPGISVLGRAEIPSRMLAAACANTSRTLFERRDGRSKEALALAVEATREQPLEISYHEQLAQIQDSLGDHQNAKEQRRIASMLAEEPQPLLRLGEEYVEKQQYEDAIRIYREVANKFGRPEQYALLGKTLYYLGAYRRSSEAYRKAVQLDPQNAYYRASLALGLTAQGDYFSAAERKKPLFEEAIQKFDEAIQIDAKVSWFYWRRSWPRTKLAAIEPGMSEELLSLAEQDLRTAIQLDPQSNAARAIELARLLARRKRFEAAAQELEKFTADQSSEFQIYMALAQIWAEGDDFERACQSAERAIRGLDKPDPEAKRTLEILQEGLTLAARAKNEPTDAGIEAQLGSVQSRLNNLDAALMHYRTAAMLNNSSTEYHKQLGNILYKQNALALAAEEWLKAGDEALTLNNLGTAYDGLDDFVKAEMYYRQACDKAKDNFVPWYNLGSLHYRQATWDLACKHYSAALERATAQNHKFAPAYLSRGNCFFHLNSPQDAEKDWREALQIDSKLSDAHFNLGVLLWASEQGREEAAEHWRKAWLVDPNFTIAEDNFLAARENGEPRLEIVDLKHPRE